MKNELFGLWKNRSDLNIEEYLKEMREERTNLELLNDSQVSSAWHQNELRRRSEDLKNGKDCLLDWEDAKIRLKKNGRHR